MSKNLTRKGLAFGALVALASTVIAGTPAFAANEVTLTPSAGTSYSFISGETYTLTAATGSLVPSSSFGTLKTKVVNNSAIAYTTTATQAGVTFTGNISAATTASTVIELDSGTATSGIASVTLAVAATAAGNFTVQSWLDADGDDVIDSTEFASEARTVTFIKPADVTATTTIATPTAGDTTISATVAFNGINNEQLTAGDVGVFFTKGDGTTLYPAASVTASSQTGTVATYIAANNYVAGQSVTVAGLVTNSALNLTGTIAAATATQFTIGGLTSATVSSVTQAGTASVSAAAAVKSGVSWSATDSFKYTTSAVTALVAAGAVKAQPLYKAAGSPASTDTIASAATATVVARKAATIVGSAVASATAKDTSAGAVSSLLNSSFSVKAVVKDGATTPVAVAGTAVTATITASGLTTTAPAKTLTVNGTTYSSSAALPGQTGVAKLALTTNASGEAVINFTTAGFADTNTFTVVFYTENLTADTVTVTQAAAAYTLTVDNAGAVSSAVDGSSVPVTVSVYDQFGGVPANDYDVTATLTSSDQVTTNASTAGSNSAAALVGGKSTINLVENGTGVGSNVYDLKVQKRLSGNIYGSTVVTAVAYTVKIKAAADIVAGVVTSSTGTQNSTTKVYEVAGPVALSLVDLKTADTRKVLETAPTFSNTQALAGTVTTAATATSVAAVIPGAVVTIAGAGLQFNAGSVYTANSITVVADASGAWAASVASNKAGKQTITVTSGAASATITVVFKTAAVDTGTALAVTGEANSISGRTITFTGTLADKYGNAVYTTGGATGQTAGSTTPTFSISYAGPGYVLGTLPTATDTTGAFKFQVLLGANDSGSAVATVKYDADGTGTAAAEISKTATTVVGPVESAATIAGATAKINFTIDNAKGELVIIKVANKTVKRFVAYSNAHAFGLKATKGSKAVKVYVAGDLVAAKTVAVK